MEGKRITDVFTCEKVSLDETFAMCPDPNFRGLTLRPHQSVLTQAILDLEHARSVKLIRPYETDSYSSLSFSACTLSEPFGSGKTFVILAVIMLRPIPRAVPELICAKDTSSPSVEITRKFTRGLLLPNVIIVSRAMLVTWEKTIAQYTNLRVMIIGDYFALRSFKACLKSGQVNNYDVIVVKNGKVTTLQRGDGNPQICSMVSSFAKIARGRCFARVFIDDYDTIHIPPGTVLPDSLFYVYVSATRKNGATSRRNTTTYARIEDLLAECRTEINSVWTSRYLLDELSVSNKARFTKDSMNITRVETYRYTYDNPDDQYMQLLGNMGADDTNALMEMLNGDAVKTAAEMVGIKTTSIADIFQKMLANKYAKYICAKKMLRVAREAHAVLSATPPHHEGKIHSMKSTNKFIATLRGGIVPTPKYSSDRLLHEVAQVIASAEEDERTTGLAIQRVVDNIREGSCQVCCIEFGIGGTFIMKCCGLIICEECGIKGNQMTRRLMHGVYDIIGSCANCKRRVSLSADMIYIDEQFDMEKLLDAVGDEDEPIVPPPAEGASAEVDEPAADDIKSPKLRALLDIINGRVPPMRTETTISIRGMISGDVDKPLPAREKTKAIVFANYKETLASIEETLLARDIPYLTLGGTYREIAATVDKFAQSDIPVLLINSQQHCAGLNLQFSTDLVFFHKIVDSDVEAQVIGRGQRIGRKYNLRIHYLCYKNEARLVH